MLRTPPHKPPSRGNLSRFYASAQVTVSTGANTNRQPTTEVDNTYIHLPRFETSNTPLALTQFSTHHKMNSSIYIYTYSNLPVSK